MDISVVSQDEKAAEKLAKDNDQIAYFDLAKGKSVTVNAHATSGGQIERKAATLSSRTSQAIIDPVNYHWTKLLKTLERPL